jgi:hypothetical protein
MPGKTASRYSLTGTRSRRQDSTTERIAAIFGPDQALPTCSQFFRPSATGRMEFSATLLDKDSLLSQRQASMLCECLVKDSASHTFKSGKNEVMRVLVLREQRTKFAASFAFDHRPGNVFTFWLSAINLFERLNDEGAHGSTVLRGTLAKLMVQRLREVDRRSDCHGLIMAPTT